MQSIHEEHELHPTHAYNRFNIKYTLDRYNVKEEKGEPDQVLCRIRCSALRRNSCHCNGIQLKIIRISII